MISCFVIVCYISFHLDCEVAPRVCGNFVTLCYFLSRASGGRVIACCPMSISLGSCRAHIHSSHIHPTVIGDLLNLLNIEAVELPVGC